MQIEKQRCQSPPSTSGLLPSVTTISTLGQNFLYISSLLYSLELSWYFTIRDSNCDHLTSLHEI